jgi:hypothetical protein
MLPQLLQLAQLHGDAEWWAERIVQTADESALVWIVAELDRRDEFEKEFYSWVPDAVAHREWFDGFWDALSSELEDFNDEGGDMAGGLSRAERAIERTKQAHKATGVDEPTTRREEKQLERATVAAAREEGAAIEERVATDPAAAAAATSTEPPARPKKSRSSSSTKRARVSSKATKKK